jgi:Homeodomain-like domain
MSAVGLSRRRARAHRLRSEGKTVREVAKALGVSLSTAHNDLRHAPRALRGLPNIQDSEGRPVSGASPGNTRSLQHGAYSERTVGPLREKHAAELARDYPGLDGRRLVLLADRLARIEAASAWLAGREIVRNEDGDVYAVVDRLERWASRAEDVLREVAAEHRDANRFEALAEFMVTPDHDEEGEDGGS